MEVPHVHRSIISISCLSASYLSPSLRRSPVRADTDAPAQALRQAGGVRGAARAELPAGAATAESRRPHFPCLDESETGAALHQPGCQSRLCLQSCRGGASFCRGRSSRSAEPDGVLGARAGARSQHQRDDEPRGRAQSACSGTESRVAQGRATPRERAYIDAVLARYTGKPEDRAQANLAFANAMRKVVAAVPRGRRRADDLCRVADEPASVELLDARRRAVRRDARSRGRAGSQC